MGSLGNKEIMAKNIKRLMQENGKDRNDVCKDLGFKYTTYTDWINANTYPRIDKIEMMANYFNVNKSDLVEDKSDLKDKEYYINKETAEMALKIKDNDNLKLLFDAAEDSKDSDLYAAYQMLLALKNKRKE